MNTSIFRRVDFESSTASAPKTNPWRSGWGEQAVYWISERAWLLYTEGRFQEALTLFDGLASLDPGNLYTKDSISALHLALGNWTVAERYAAEVLGAEPGNVSALVRRCEAFLQQGKVNEAQADLDEIRYAGADAQARRMEMRLAPLRQGVEISSEQSQKRRHNTQHGAGRADNLSKRAAGA